MIKFIRTNINYNLCDYFKDINNQTILITSNNKINYFKRKAIDYKLNHLIEVTSIDILIKKIYQIYINKQTILNTNKQKLLFIKAFNNINNKLSLLKDYNPNVIDDIINIYNNESQYKLVKAPFRSDLLKEVDLVIEEYLLLLNGYFIDNNQLYQVVIDYLKNNIIINKKIIIDHFYLLNELEKEFILNLSNQNDITLFLFNDDINNTSLLLNNYYLYFKTHINYDEEVLINNELSKEKKCIINNLEYNFKPTEIALYEANDLFNEVSFVANQILKLIKNENKTFSDFGIVSNNIDDYELYFDLIFKGNNIPYHKKENIDYNLFEFIKILFKEDITNKDIIKILKYNYFNISYHLINELEIYIVKNHLENEIYKPININSHIIEVVNNYIFDFKNNIIKNMNNQEFLMLLYNHIESILKNSNYDFMNNYQTWNYFVEFIDDFNLIYGNDVFNNKLFVDVFNYHFKNIYIYENYINEVSINPLNQITNTNPKIIFFIGVNEGLVPKETSKNLLYGNYELNNIYHNYPLFDNILYEKINILFTLVNYPLLYISYPKVDNSNKKINPANIIKNLKKIFPLIKIYQENDIEQFSFGKNLLFNTFKTWENNDLNNKLYNYYINDKDYNNFLKNTKNIQFFYTPNKLKCHYFNNLFLSPSKIDTYVKCPFKYYCENILKLNPEIKQIYDNRITGTFIHGFLEKLINSKNDNYKEISKNYVNSFINEYPFLNKQIYLYFLNKLVENTLYLWEYIKNDLSNNSFKPIYTELNISKEEDFKNVKYNVNNVNVYLTGIIDRIDQYQNLYRIIDYKTGNKEINLNDFANGINLQLFIYMTILSSQDKLVSGIFYMPSFVKFSDDPVDYKLKGLILDNEINIEAYGKTETKNDMLYSDEEYRLFVNYTEQNIKEVASNIIDGNININPIKSTRICDYCNFKSVCGTEEGTKNNHKISKYSKEEIKAIIGGEINGKMDE